MRRLIFVFVLAAFLAACGPSNGEFYGMSEREQIRADAQRDAAAIQATAQANQAAIQATVTANTNASNQAIAQTYAHTSIENNRTWSAAAMVIVLLMCGGLVAGIMAYWFGRGRVAIIESGARVQMAQLDHSAAMALLTVGPSGGEAIMSVEKYKARYGDDYIARQGTDQPWYGATERGLVRLTGLLPGPHPYKEKTE